MSDPNPSRPMRWVDDRVLLLIVAAALVLGLVYNGVILLGYGPDEPRHMNYVKLLFDEHTLPYLEANGAEHAGAHTFHPPLYYLVLVPFYAALHGLPGPSHPPDQPAAFWHLIRLVSLALCLICVPLAYQIALRAGHGDRGIARLAAAQLAFLPMFGMTSATINNDSAALLAVTLFLWLLAVRYPTDRSWKSAAVLGLCCGLGTLCKATVLLCDVIAFVLYLLAQDGKSAPASTRSWGRLGILLLVTALLAGPWHLRSMHLYGTFTPLPPPLPNPLLPNPKNGMLVLMLHDNFPRVFGMANLGIFNTMWSQKDWIPEDWRDLIYGALAVYVMAALVGVILHRVRARRSLALGSPAPAGVEAEKRGSGDPEAIAGRIARWSAYGAFVATWLAVLQEALFVHWGWADGGRYLLPAFVGFSIFVALGWRDLVRSANLRVVLAGWSVGLLALNVTAIYWLLSYLNPTFGPKH